MQKIGQLLGHLPLVGGLRDCKWIAHWNTLREITVLLPFSMMPIWLAALIVFQKGPDYTSATFFAALRSPVAHGELFMYSTSLLAPVFWMALYERSGARIFPSKLAHLLTVIVVCLIAALFFGLINSRYSELNIAFAFKMSVLLFFISIFLWYLATVYHNARLDVSQELKRQELDFSAAFDKHRP